MKAEQGCQRQVHSAAARVGCVWMGNETKTKKSYQMKWIHVALKSGYQHNEGCD